MSKHDKLQLFIFPMIVLLQLMDVIMTALILGAGGIELNPIMKYVIEQGGMYTVASIKLFWVAVLGWLVLIKWHTLDPDAREGLYKGSIGIVIIYSALAFWLSANLPWPYLL